MDNKGFHDSNSDIAIENERNAGSVEIDKQSEGDNGHETEGEVKELTDENTEERQEEESKITDRSANVEKESETSDESGGNEGKEVTLTSETLVSRTTLLTPVNVPHPDPPPRQRKKSNTGPQTKPTENDTHAKPHGEKNESFEEDETSCKSQETTHSRKQVSDTPGREIRNEKADTTKADKETNTTDYGSIGREIRNRGDKADTPNGAKETKPTIGQKDLKTKEKEKDDEKGSVGLKQELSLVNCVGLIVGNIIGTGIFVSPRGVLQYTGSVGMSLIVWVISGVMAIVGAFCYAELGTMVPQSGGNYSYLHEAYGSLAAFLYLWMTVTISIPGGRAVAALSFANYVVQPFFPNEQSPPDSALRIIGILLIVLLTYISAKNVRWATRVQDILALTKVFALIVIIVVGFFHLARGTTDNFKDPMAGTSTSPALIVTAFYQTLYAYDGWDSLNGIMEELKDPIRNMPRAIAISVTVVMVIYVLTNIAYFAVLPKDLMLASPAVAVTFGNLALGMVAFTLPIFVACSISGGLNGSMFISSRLIFVASRRGHLPRFISLVHVENNTPVTSLFFVAVMSMLMFVTSDVRVLINYLGFANNLFVLLSVSSFFWFRLKQPDLPRPIKVWLGFPIIFITLSFFLCVMPIVKQPFEVLAGLLVIGSGLPVYYFFVHREVKPQRLVTAMDKVTYMCQLLFMAVPEERTS